MGRLRKKPLTTTWSDDSETAGNPNGGELTARRAATSGSLGSNGTICFSEQGARIRRFSFD